MMVTTGGRTERSPCTSTACASSASSASSSLSLLALWPSSSTTSTAVSWSITSLMVTIMPILNNALTTSLPFKASLFASSETRMFSPTKTSRRIGAVGFEKPCAPEDVRDGSAVFIFGFLRLPAELRRARSSAVRCNWPVTNKGVVPSSPSLSTIAWEPRALCLGAGALLPGALAGDLFIGGRLGMAGLASERGWSALCGRGACLSLRGSTTSASTAAGGSSTAGAAAASRARRTASSASRLAISTILRLRSPSSSASSSAC